MPIWKPESPRTSWPFECSRRFRDAVDFAQETKSTQQLYGMDQPHCRQFGMQMLAARRFVERGVRFVQIQYGGGRCGKPGTLTKSLKQKPHQKTHWRSINPSRACWRICSAAECSMKRWSYSRPSLAERRDHRVRTVAIITSSASAYGWPAAACDAESFTGLPMSSVFMRSKIGTM